MFGQPEAATLEPRQTFALELDRQIACARWSPDGRVLFAGCYDGLVRRWDTSGEEPRELEPLAGHHGWAWRLAAFRVADSSESEPYRLASADSWGRLACRRFAGDAAETVWEHESAHDGWIHDLAATPEGTRLVTVGRDRVARVWSAADGTLVREFTELPGEACAVAIDETGESIVVADELGRLRQWNVSTGELLREIDTGLAYRNHDQDVPPVRVLRFLADGRLLAAGSHPNSTNNQQGKPTIHVYDLDSGERTRVLELGDANHGFVHDLALHPDGFLVVATSGQPGKGQLLLWRVDDDAPFFAWDKLFNCHAVALDPEGRRIAVASTNRNSQGNGAVRDKDGTYLGNTSPLTFFALE